MPFILRILLSSCFGLLLQPGQAQQVIVNSSGDKIIMYPDGSWRPVTDQDSILVRQYMARLEHRAAAPTDTLRNEGEEQNYLIRRGHNLRSRITVQEKKVQHEFRIATNAQFKAAELLRAAEANKEVIEPERIKALEVAFDASVKTLRDAKLNQQAIKKLSTAANVLVENPLQITQRKLDQLETKYNLYLSHFERVPVSEQPIANEEPHPASIPAKAKPTTTASVTPTDPVIAPPTASTYRGSNRSLETTPYDRQPYACKPILDSIDEASGRKHVALPEEVIFTHTDADLRPFLKDRELITCKGNTWKIGPFTYLNIEFQISSSHSQSNFGALASGSLFRLKLLNGEFVSLYNLKTDKGHIDAYTGNTVFSGQYALGKDAIKKLRSSELDKIRVLWGTGYEDYDVFNLDFFYHQLDCLQSH